MESKGTKIAKNKYEKIKWEESVYLIQDLYSNSNQYCVVLWRSRHIDQWKRIKNPEIKSQICPTGFW